MLSRSVSVTVVIALLVACKPATDSNTPVATGSAAVTAGLSVRYSVIDLADIEDPAALTSLCEAENMTLRKQLQQLEAAGNTPTLEGFYESFNSLSASLNNLSFTAESLSNVHPDAAVRTAAEACVLQLSAISTDIKLSRPVYDAVGRLDVSGEDQATQHSVEKTLLSFRLSGVDKDDVTRERIRELNIELISIGQEFDRNIREDVRTLELDSVDDLKGLPEDYIAAHPPHADGKIRITTQYPDLLPVITYAHSDTLRKELYSIYLNRAYPQNKALLEQLMEKRYELAQLVGFANYAELVTADKMVGSPERVAGFLEELKGYTAKSNEWEYQVLLERLHRDQPDAERVEIWQSSYISEKVRTEQFEVDSKEIREYFSYNNTRDGILTLVQDLFQVQIRPWDTRTWHEDVQAYELLDGERVLGRFFLDMHPREGKYQHAAMFPFTNGIEGKQLPLAALVCNFPVGDALMQHKQVITFLHEFGHLIHWIFAGHQRWDNVSGINVEWDFVEAPSQMLEEWVWDYETISRFARNGDGEVIPKDLLDRMIAARDFGLGLSTRRQLSFAAMSLALYNGNPAHIDAEAVYPRMAREYTNFDAIPGTHFYASFGHLNGYSAIYYTYQWSKAIATDMLTRFEAQGLRNVEVAGAYRDIVLGGAGTRPAGELVAEFLGREISFKSYADRLRGTE